MKVSDVLFVKSTSIEYFVLTFEFKLTNLYSWISLFAVLITTLSVVILAFLTSLYRLTTPVESPVILTL